MYTGLSNLGLSGYHSQYSELKEQAIAAARRNNASLWFAGAPADLAGFVWQDSAGTTPATGTDPIGRLADRAGSNAATQATAANKPTLELQSNGYFGMRFDGTDDVLQHLPIAQPPANITAIFSGVRPAVLAGFDVFWAQAAGGASEGLPYLAINTSRNLVGQVSGGAGAVVNVQDPGVTADGEKFVASLQITSGNLNLLKNGALVSSAAGVSGVYTTATNASIGAILRAIPGSYMNGVCSLVCVSNNAMSASDRIAIERFAALLSGATYA